jgi:hypothetical protein
VVEMTITELLKLLDVILGSFIRELILILSKFVSAFE